MSRIVKTGLMVGILVFVATLTGCGTSPTGSDTSDPINLTDTTVMNGLCGDTAAQVLRTVTPAADALSNSGKRHTLTKWGIDDPSDDAVVTSTIAALQVRANTSCETATSSPTPEASATTAPPSSTQDGTVGVQNPDGSTEVVPVIRGGHPEKPLGPDTTNNPATPPLLDYSLRYNALTLSWDDLVQRVGSQQWFIDGLDARAKKTGFDWDDVLKFAKNNKTKSGEVANPLAIKVYNTKGCTPAKSAKGKSTVTAAAERSIRASVASYITPEVEETIGTTVEELPILCYGDVMNTLKAGTKQSPVMGDYLDKESMIRVSLLPFVYDKDGYVIGLDDDHGAGVFIDCGNLHWIPKVPPWKCTDSPCKPPVKPEPEPEPEPTCPPDKPYGNPETGCKDSPRKDPGPQGKAPRGHGKNDDPGPGPYVPPKDMEQPPKKPRENPTPPPAEPPTQPKPKPEPTSKPTPVPTKDPAPPPAPEPEAPPTSAPVTECIPIPGVEDC